MWLLLGFKHLLNKARYMYNKILKHHHALSYPLCPTVHHIKVMDKLGWKVTPPQAVCFVCEYFPNSKLRQLGNSSLTRRKMQIKEATIQTSNEAEQFCLIKLVQAVQSLREKNIHSMAWWENGQIIEYKLINVSSPCSEQWIAFRKLKR